MQESAYKLLKEKALALLARREHSVSELRIKLLRASADEENDHELLDELLDELIELNYLSDERYAEMLVRSRVLKGYGAQRIRQELQQQGVSGELINQCVDEAEVDWFTLAKEARLRKFGEAQHDTPKEKARRQRYLFSRGFNGEQIEFALEKAED